MDIGKGDIGLSKLNAHNSMYSTYAVHFLFKFRFCSISLTFIVILNNTKAQHRIVFIEISLKYVE